MGRICGIRHVQNDIHDTTLENGIGTSCRIKESNLSCNVINVLVEVNTIVLKRLDQGQSNTPESKFECGRYFLLLAHLVLSNAIHACLRVNVLIRDIFDAVLSIGELQSCRSSSNLNRKLRGNIGLIKWRVGRRNVSRNVRRRLRSKSGTTRRVRMKVSSRAFDHDQIA